MAGKIKSYPILNAPLKRSIQFQIPMQWIKDMQLDQGYSIDLYRDEEDRFILLGISNKFNIIVVNHCYLEDNSEIRIFSARKATKNEKRQYLEVLS